MSKKVGPYQLLYKQSVEKELRRIPTAKCVQIIKKISSLALNPYPAGVVKLQGATDLYRLRHADYRIVYQISGEQLIILIIKVGHRSVVQIGT